MILKRYIVDNMQEGIETVKKELGSEAVILNTKPIGKKGVLGLFKKSKIEILVAYDPNEEISINNSPVPNFAKEKKQKAIIAPTVSFQKEEQTPELYKLESKIANIDHTLNAFLNRMDNNFNDKFANYSKGIRSFASNLLENEVKEDLVYKLSDGASQAVMQENMEEVEAIKNTISHFFGKPKVIALKRNKPAVVLFVGITGVGKTTTLSKLATSFTVGKSKKVALITTDTYKIASSEQLKVYSEILNIPLSIVYSADELNKEIQKYQDKDIIFVDTGKCPDEAEYKKNIMDFIETANPDEIYIVINANMSYKSCANVLEYYNYIRSFKVIVTKLDEAMSLGALFNIRALSNKPISYVTDGQVLTENLEEFESKSVIDKLLG